jgi:hypothetical protein
MSVLREQLRPIVRPMFGNNPEHTYITAKRLNDLLLGSSLCDRIPSRGNDTTTTISFTVVLLQKSLPENYRQTNKIMEMILRRILKTLPSNVDFHETPIELSLVHPMIYQHSQPHTRVPEFSLAVDGMLAPCLRGEIRLSFSEIVHAFSIIQSHMSIAFERYSDMALEVLQEQESRSWRVFDVGFGCPDEANEIKCILEADEHLEEFQQRFSDLIECCCFYFLMQTKRTFSRFLQ